MEKLLTTLMRKKSKYKPRRVIANTMAWIKSGLQKVTKHDEFTVLALKNHAAFDALRRGVATKEDMQLLVNMSNMTEALAQVNKAFRADYGQLILDGQESLLEVCRRSKYVCRASELMDICDLLELHDAQMEIATIKEVEDAMKIVNMVITNKQAEVI